MYNGLHRHAFRAGPLATSAALPLFAIGEVMFSLNSPVVSAEWLADNITSVRVVDVRFSVPTGPMRSAYLAGHIPTAVFADMDTDLSAAAGSRGRHPLPLPEAFAEARSRLAIDRPVVAYDDRSGAVAARLWWMLDSIGIPAAILDGGIQAWDAPLVSGAESVAPVTAAPIPWPEARFVDVDDVVSRIAAGIACVDARSADRFSGLPNPIDSRPGHIPGAISRPWEANLDAAGHFKPAKQLRDEFAQLGVDQDEFVSSCGSGVTACHNLLAARLAGLPASALYTGSWSEWSQDPRRPIA